MKGFGVVEMLVYTTLLVLGVGATIGLLLSVVQANAKVGAMREAQANATWALDVLTKEIRSAESIYTPAEYPVPPGTPWGQLSLETTKNPPTGEASTYVDFFLCGTRLCLKREGQNPVALTTEDVAITRLEFAPVVTGAVPSVRVGLDVEYVNPSNRPELNAVVNANTTVSLRSY